MKNQAWTGGRIPKIKYEHNQSTGNTMYLQIDSLITDSEALQLRDILVKCVEMDMKVIVTKKP